MMHQCDTCGKGKSEAIPLFAPKGFHYVDDVCCQWRAKQIVDENRGIHMLDDGRWVFGQCHVKWDDLRNIFTYFVFIQEVVNLVDFAEAE